MLRHLDFVHKLRELVMVGGSGKFLSHSMEASLARVLQKRAELGSEALLLAELHGKFEHK